MHAFLHSVQVCTLLVGAWFIISACSPAPQPTPTPQDPTTVRPTTESQPTLASTATIAEISPIISIEQVNGGCQVDLPGTSEMDAFGCPTIIDPFAQLTFDDALHEAWYQRFWTGSCESVSAFCLSGEGWFDRVKSVTEPLPGQDQGVARMRMWALGRVVGYDWARDNSLSIFTNGDLQRWNDMMNGDDTIDEAMSLIEQEVCERSGTNALGEISNAPACGTNS